MSIGRFSMDREEFFGTLDERGKMIFYSLEQLEKDRRQHLLLKPTDEGYHLCIKYGSDPNENVEFIQIWGGIEPYQKLETRFHRIREHFTITPKILNKLRELLEPLFEDAPHSNHDNMRLRFRDLPPSFQEKEAKDLVEKIEKAAAVIKACPQVNRPS